MCIDYVEGGIVVEAKRLFSKKEGQRSEILSVLLMFEKVLPKNVHMGFLAFTVREFVPPQLRCFKCPKNGTCSNSVQRKEKIPSAKCEGEHDYGECGNNVKVNCFNGGGTHSPRYSGCQVQKKARGPKI
jgi:hypothetical protein